MNGLISSALGDAFKSDMQKADEESAAARKKDPIYLIYPPLFEAVHSGDIESVRLIVNPPPEEGVEHEPVDVKQRDNIGANVLHWATGRNDPMMIMFLASIDVPVNQQDRNGFSPLHYACMDNKLSAALALVDAGADINLQDVSYCTPLHRAIPVDEVLSVALLKHTVKTVRVDKRNSEGQSLIVMAARYNRTKLVQALLILGANINDSDMFGWTSAHWAARKNHHTVMAVLLAEGADVTKQDTGWYTPLEIAAHENSERTHKQLERHMVTDQDPSNFVMAAKMNDVQAKKGDKDSINAQTRSAVSVEDQIPSTAIELLNWIDGNQVKNQYQKTKQLVHSTLSSYGSVRNIVLPGYGTPRAGAVYAEFYVVEEAIRAMQAIEKDLPFVDRYYCYESLRHIEAEWEDWDKESPILCVYNLFDRSMVYKEEHFEDQEAALRKIFSNYGKVKNVHVPRPREKDIPNVMGNAFVEMESVAEAKAAKKKVGVKQLKKHFSPATEIAYYSETLYSAKIYLQVGLRIQQKLEVDLVDIETAREAIGKVSKILVLDGLLEDDELENENDIYAVQMSVQKEARKYGEPEQVYIPRLTPGMSLEEAGVGRVFLVMDNRGSAQAALRAFQADVFSFANIEYYPEVMFEMGHYSEDVSQTRELRQAHMEIGNLDDNESRVVVIDNLVEQDNINDADEYKLLHRSITLECRSLVDPSQQDATYVRIPRPGETGAGRVFVVCPTVMDGKRVRGGLRRGAFGFASINYMSEVLFDSNMLDKLIGYDEIDEMTGVLAGKYKQSESLKRHRIPIDNKPPASNKLTVGGLIHDADLATEDMAPEEQFSKDQDLDKLLQTFQLVCEKYAPVSIIDLQDTDPDEEVKILVECPKPNDARAIKNGLSQSTFAYLRVQYNQILAHQKSKSKSSLQPSQSNLTKSSMTSVANLLNSQKSARNNLTGAKSKNKAEAAKARLNRQGSMSQKKIQI